MFWLFEPNKEIYDFVQIFENNCNEIDSDYVYKLDLDNFPKISGTNYYDIVTDKKIQPIIVNYCIKIIGKNISWTNLDTNVTINFIQKYNFVKPSENKIDKPIFEFNYKINKHKLPELTTCSYDFYYPHIKFEIYKINNNLILIKETNQINNILRNYVVAKKIF